MALLNIGGVDLIAPSSYKVTLSDLDSADSGRSETGIMTRNRVRDGVAKIEAKWEMITADELTEICDLIEPEKFTVKYSFGGTKTASMYVGDRSCEMKSIETDGSTWWNLSFGLIEY